MEATWKPHEKHGELTERSDLPDSVFAFPKQRKEPMTEASHVRNAIARFDQTIGVSDEDRKLAFANIKKAARHYGVEMSENDGRNWAAIRAPAAPPKSAESRRGRRQPRGRAGSTTRRSSLSKDRPKGVGDVASRLALLRRAWPLTKAAPEGTDRFDFTDGMLPQGYDAREGKVVRPQGSRLMFKTLLVAASFAAFVAVGLPLDQSSARAEQMTCREAAKLKFPADWKSRAAYRRACKAAWKAHRLNPQPLPPKA